MPVHSRAVELPLAGPGLNPSSGPRPTGPVPPPAGRSARGLLRQPVGCDSPRRTDTRCPTPARSTSPQSAPCTTARASWRRGSSTCFFCTALGIESHGSTHTREAASGSGSLGLHILLQVFAAAVLHSATLCLLHAAPAAEVDDRRSAGLIRSS